MGQQTIGIGTTANDGTGDSLRDGADKINDNFTELYSIHGWAHYVDGETSPTTQTINTTFSKILIDGLGASSESDYLPREIRGVSELWDTSNDKITPIAIGDSYMIRIDFTVTGKTGLPTLLELTLDIGGTGSPTIQIVNTDITLSKTAPYSLSVSFPVFCLTTFNTNGGELYWKTDTGTLTISSRLINIYRISSGEI